MMVDPLRGVFRMKRIPMCGFVSMNGRVRGTDALNEGEAIGFRFGDGRDGPATAFAGDDDNAALVALVLGKAAINAIFLEVRRANDTAEVSAIDFDRAGKGCALDFGSDGFAELVSENEGRLVLAIEVAGKLEHRNTLDRVRKNDDRSKEVPKLILRLARIVPLVTLN